MDDLIEDGKIPLLDIIKNINRFIKKKDYQRAINSVDFLYRVFYSFRKEHGDEYIDEIKTILKDEKYSILYEHLLSLADDKSYISPIMHEKSKFKIGLKKAQRMLNSKTFDGAHWALKTIQEAIGNYTKSLSDDYGNKMPEHLAFRLFWKLWFLLDEMVLSPVFKGDYERYVASLYGVISPVIHSKDGAFCLSNFYEEVFIPSKV